MVRFACATLILAVVASQLFAEDEAALGAPRIYWRNGDTLEGAIISVDEHEFSWSSRIFAKPLRLQRDAVHMIRFPGEPRDLLDEQANSDSQTIETRDGNHFFGVVQQANAETLEVETLQYGTVRIHRDAVSLIANPIQRAQVYSGPKGLRGWSTLTYGRKLSEWDELPDGRLTTKMVAAELYRSLPANGSVDIDVELIWRNNPSFQIRFLTPYGKTTKETVKLETRAANYVIQTLGSNGRFRQVDSLPKETKKCRFLLRWNQSASDLAVYRGQRYLGKINVDRQENQGTAGVYIKNTGPRLTLSRLEIRARSKLDINLTDPTKDTILRADNQSLAGRVETITKTAVTLIDSAGTSIEVPWSDIPEIGFRQPGNQVESRPGDTECIFQNGETLKGRLIGGDDRGVTIEVPGVDDPIRCRYDGMERIIFNSKSVPPGKHIPRLLAGDVVIHGGLAPTMEGQIGWLPVGGVEPVSTAEQVAVRLELQPIQGFGSIQDDLLYLRSGDVIPCKVHAADTEQLTLSCVFAQDRVVEAGEIKAVELAAAPVSPIHGFDRHWEVEDAARAKIGKTSLLFTQPTTVRHRDILKGCDRIEFVVSCETTKQSGSFLQVTLHGEEEGQQRTIPFYFSGNDFFVMGNGGNAFQRIDGADRFSVTIQSRSPFSISVNGVAVNGVAVNGPPTSAMGQTNTAWLGLSFGLTRGQLFLNPRLRVIGEGPTVVTITDFAVSQTMRPVISQTTAGLDATPLLTVPRNRESSSVTHLAIGANNDIARGRLLKLDATTAQLESGSARLDIPRKSLSGLIWLEGGTGDSSQAMPETRVVLRDTSTFGLDRPTLSEAYLQGHHPQLGPCKISVAEIHAVLRGDARNLLHHHEFLAWKARDAKQPAFTTDPDGRHEIETDLVGKCLDLEAELVASPETFRLSEHVGRVVVIEFWATWCAPCVRNMPRLIESMREYAPEQASFVAVNQGENPLVVATLLAAKGWDMPTGLDPEGHAARTFKVRALPQTVVVDRAGKIAAVFVGATPNLQTELKATIDRLLEK